MRVQSLKPRAHAPAPAGRAAGTHPSLLHRRAGGIPTVGVYEDGLPGEIFITMAKQGSTISGLMDSFATVVSLALQYGVPLTCFAANSACAL